MVHFPPAKLSACPIAHFSTEEPPMTIRSRRRHRGPASVRLSLYRFEDRVVPALTVSGVAPLQLPANVTLFPGLWLATLSDSDGNTDVTKYTGTIDWGDGQTTGATF